MKQTLVNFINSYHYAIYKDDITDQDLPIIYNYFFHYETNNSRSINNSAILDKYFGLYHATQKDMDGAQFYFKQAIKKGDNSTYLLYAQIYNDYYQNESYLKYLKTAQSKGVYHSNSCLAHYYFEKDKLDLAQKYAELGYDNHEDLALFILVSIYIKSGNVIQQKKYVNIGIETNNLLVLKLELLHFIQDDDKETILEICDLMIEHDKELDNTLDSYLYFVLEYLYKKTYFGNLKKYIQIGINKKKFIPILQLYRLAYLEQNIEMAGSYKKLVLENPDCPGYCYYFYANICKEINDSHNMKIYLEKAIKLDIIQAYDMLGSHYYKIHDYENLLKLCQIGIKKNINSCFILLDKYYSARNEYENIIDIYFINKRYEKTIILLTIYINNQNNKIDLRILEIISQIDPIQLSVCPDLLIINLLINQNLDLIKSHFDYKLNSQGYIEAEKNFNFNLLSTKK